MTLLNGHLTNYHFKTVLANLGDSDTVWKKSRSINIQIKAISFFKLFGQNRRTAILDPYILEKNTVSLNRSRVRQQVFNVSRKFVLILSRFHLLFFSLPFYYFCNAFLSCQTV